MKIPIQIDSIIRMMSWEMKVCELASTIAWWKDLPGDLVFQYALAKYTG